MEQPPAYESLFPENRENAQTYSPTHSTYPSTHSTYPSTYPEMHLEDGNYPLSSIEDDISDFVNYCERDFRIFYHSCTIS